MGRICLGQHLGRGQPILTASPPPPQTGGFLTKGYSEVSAKKNFNSHGQGVLGAADTQHATLFVCPSRTRRLISLTFGRATHASSGSERTVCSRRFPFSTRPIPGPTRRTASSAHMFYFLVLSSPVPKIPPTNHRLRSDHSTFCYTTGGRAADRLSFVVHSCSRRSEAATIVCRVEEGRVLLLGGSNTNHLYMGIHFIANSFSGGSMPRDTGRFSGRRGMVV